MNDIVIVALISFFGTLIGTFGGIITSNKLTTYRIEQLEKRVDKYNSVIERTALVEQSVKSAHKRIDELKEEIFDDEHQRRYNYTNNHNDASPN